MRPHATSRRCLTVVDFGAGRLLAVLCALVAFAVFPAATLAAGWATGVEAALPANAATNPDVNVDSVSCGSAGNCSAVGGYTDNSGNDQGLLMTESSGTWATGVEVSLPANAGSNTVVVSSVSCASAGNCSAVGDYQDSSGDQQGLLMTESSGTWPTGVELTLPANAGAQPYAYLGAVSCASPGNCTAIGEYSDGSGNLHGLLVTESSGTWATGVEAPVPGNASSPSVVEIYSVSCTSPGNCSAIGAYAAPGAYDGLLLTESSGTWTAVEAPLPADGIAVPHTAEPVSVSCSSPGNCTAVGLYETNANDVEALLLTQTSGTWTVVQAPVPVDAAADPNAYMESVSCTSPGECSAVGRYDNSSGDQMGLLMTESSGTWSGLAAPLPADADSPPSASLNSVSCTSPGNCSAAGGYMDGAGSYQGLLETESAGTWATGVEATLPANANSTPNANTGYISCASPGDCSVVGNYKDSSGNTQGLLLGSAASTTPPVSAPPQSGTLPTITGTAQDGSTLSESHATWSPDPTSYAYQWEDCDTSGAGCQAISDATAQTYTLQSTDVGHTIRVQETATGAGGSSDVTSAPTGVVAAVSPGEVSISTAGALSQLGLPIDPGITVSCPASGPSCTAQETVTVMVGAGNMPIASGPRAAHTVTVASASFTIAPGSSAQATFVLNRLGRILLSDHRHVEVQVGVSGQSGNATQVTATKSVRLHGHLATYHVSAMRVNSDGTISLRVKVAAPGRVNILVTAWNDNLAPVAITSAARLLKPARLRFVVARATASPKKATVLTLRVRTDVRGSRMIAHPAYPVSLRLWVSYIPLFAYQANAGYYGLHPDESCSGCRQRMWPAASPVRP